MTSPWKNLKKVTKKKNDTKINIYLLKTLNGSPFISSVNTGVFIVLLFHLVSYPSKSLPTAIGKPTNKIMALDFKGNSYDSTLWYSPETAFTFLPIVFPTCANINKK